MPEPIKNTDPAGNPVVGQQGEPDPNKPGEKGSDPPSPSPTPKPSGDGQKPVKKTEPKSSDDDGDAKLITLTQGQLDDMMAKRAERARKEADAELEEMRTKYAEVEKERNTFRDAEVAKVKQQFEALPAEVKALCTIPVDKLNEADNFAQMTAFLSKAGAVAEKFTGKPTDPPKPAPKPGFAATDPKPAGSTDAAEKEKNLNTATSHMAARW